MLALSSLREMSVGSVWDQPAAQKASVVKVKGLSGVWQLFSRAPATGWKDYKSKAHLGYIAR